MECNRDEALRAKSIAEGKLEIKDFAGAKKFALKAQALYPGLEGISQMLTTLDVHAAGENKICGEVDWYGVLSVNPTADDETIKKQYRKLALTLHPDKNKSVGADGAFKLISEAWSLLSDKAKRLAYNQRRSSIGFQQKVSLHTACSSAPPRTNGVYNFASRPTSVPKAQVPKAQKSSVKVPPSSTPAPSSKRADTFWTICHRCKMHYEYLKMYLNSTLLCPNCKQAFMASETAPPFNINKPPNQVPRQRQQAASSGHASNRNATDSGRNVPPAQRAGPVQTPGPVEKPGSAQKSGPVEKPGSAQTSRPVEKPGPVKTPRPVENPGPSQKTMPSPVGVSSVRTSQYKQVPLFGKTDVGSTDPFITKTNLGSMDPFIAAKAANVVQQAQNKLKRAHTEPQASASWEEYMKKRKLDEDSDRHGTIHNVAQGNGVYKSPASVTGPGSRSSGFPGTNRKSNTTKDSMPPEIRNLLIEMGRKEIQARLNLWKLETRNNAVLKENDNTTDSKKDGHNSSSGMQGHNRDKNTDLPPSSINNQKKKGQASCATDIASDEDVGSSMNVPDPDFHDFDHDRTESSFGDNEVWSAYDNDDGMPRFYALVSKVLSTKPFKVKLGWLNSTNTSEFGKMNWVGSGFYKTCGEFWVGRYETCKSINSFSQKVHWTKGPRGSILILPQKGEVWALYANWSLDWSHDTPDDFIHKYDMVTVLDDYNEEKGVSVAPLVKVVGFKTVFRPNLGPEVIKRIPREEMLRFSHRVPHHLLTGQEAQSSPKGCLELDPAATPLELLQVTTESNIQEIGPNSKNSDEKVSQSDPSSSLREISDQVNEGKAVHIAEDSVEVK